jgi:hypothetical protein
MFIEEKNIFTLTVIVYQNQLPLPWWEGIKGRGISSAVSLFYSPSPRPLVAFGAAGGR